MTRPPEFVPWTEGTRSQRRKRISTGGSTRRDRYLPGTLVRKETNFNREFYVSGQVSSRDASLKTPTHPRLVDRLVQDKIGGGAPTTLVRRGGISGPRTRGPGGPMRLQTPERDPVGTGRVRDDQCPTETSRIGRTVTVHEGRHTRGKPRHPRHETQDTTTTPPQVKPL